MNETSSAGGTLLDRLRYRDRAYSAAQEAIARDIIGDPARAVREPITALAARAGVSTGSIVRFARLFGFSGFRELKLALAVETRHPLAHPDPMDPSPLVSAAVAIQVRTLLALRRTIDPVTFECVADLVSSVFRIDLLGVGASAAPATFCRFQLSLLGLHCRLIGDPGEATASAGFLTRGDMLLVFSRSGRTREVVEAARRARAAGATVVVITASSSGPLTRSATATIQVEKTSLSNAGQSEAPFYSACVALVDALCRAVAVRIGPAEVARRQGHWAEARFSLKHPAETLEQNVNAPLTDL